MKAAITHVLLDIEGTTCPVRFVSDTLFPYAAARLEAFLESHQTDAVVQHLVVQVALAWRDDPDPAAQALLQSASPNTNSSGQIRTDLQILPYLHWLIRKDRKLTALKDLQGLIWEEGYGSGALQGPLYPDVAPALHRWRAAGLGIAVYSSGSVKAQQLIYGHSNAGDLRPLFQHWFDTKIGSKLEPESYQLIVAELGAEPQSMLFVSDSLSELNAASTSGLNVLFCDRSESASGSMDNGGFATITTFNGLDPHPRTSGERHPESRSGDSSLKG